MVDHNQIQKMGQIHKHIPIDANIIYLDSKYDYFFENIRIEQNCHHFSHVLKKEMNHLCCFAFNHSYSYQNDRRIALIHSPSHQNPY